MEQFPIIVKIIFLSKTFLLKLKILENPKTCKELKKLANIFLLLIWKLWLTKVKWLVYSQIAGLCLFISPMTFQCSYLDTLKYHPRISPPFCCNRPSSADRCWPSVTTPKIPLSLVIGSRWNGYFRAKLFPVCNFQRGLVCCKDWYSSWGDSLALLNYTCLELRIDPVYSLSGKLTFLKIMKVGWNIFLKPKTQLCSLKIFSLCMKIFMGCFRGFRI